MDADPAAVGAMRALGFATVPVTAVGERAVQGFNVQALRDLLGLAAEGGRSLSPDELLQKYRLIFEAAKRAILQIPEDKLDWMTPGRERTLRQLTWHIFDRAEEFARLVDGGEYSEDRANDYMILANATERGATSRLMRIRCWLRSRTS